MAANDYYNTTSDSQRRRNEAPLPPLPNPYSAYNPNPQQYSASSISSPFDDPSYRPHGRQSQQSIAGDHSYYGAGGGGQGYDSNSYSDDIPLRPQKRKSSSDLLNPDARDHDMMRPQMGERKKSRTGATRRKKKKGLWSGRIPFAVYTFSAIQIVVFIAEMIKAGVLTGSPIEIHPQFNPMIGPSPYVLINMGARYVPCMHNTTFTKKPAGKCPAGSHLGQNQDETQHFSSDPSVPWPCPNTTKNDALCSLNQLCGFNENKDSTQPRQWFRFIVPIFMHAGIVHIGFNLLLQLTLGKEMEQEIGPLRFALVYLSSGIFGFVLGGNFAPNGIASTGASGALFGIIALMLLDLLYYWDERKSPWVDLMWILFEIGISFVLGLLPGLDNFSHIGGFLMGLVLGVCILHSPNALRKRISLGEAPYTPVSSTGKYNNMGAGGIQGFAKQPVGFFKGRKPLWWAWWLVRVVALIGVLASFIILLENFYKPRPTGCSWCKHLSCLNINNWCDIGYLQPAANCTQDTPSKRDIFGIRGSSFNPSEFL